MTNKAISCNDKKTSKVTLKVNGEIYFLTLKSKETLLETLRDQLELTGTKEGCGTGDCGACTVLMNGKVINSCLVLTAEAEGSEVTTIEGVSSPDGLHPIQESFIEQGAIQCGFCTPGMVISAKALLDNNPNPSEQDIRKALSGNLCRCTGYVKIVKAVQESALKIKGGK